MLFFCAIWVRFPCTSAILFANLAICAENLLDQEFTADAPNKTWTGDITYIWTKQGWMYLAVVLDLFNREIVGCVHEKKDNKGYRNKSPCHGHTAKEAAERVDISFRQGKPVRKQ